MAVEVCDLRVKELRDVRPLSETTSTLSDRGNIVVLKNVRCPTSAPEVPERPVQ
jgi:hypothetical protein